MDEAINYSFDELVLLTEQNSEVLAQSVELLKAIYTSQLFVIGCVGAFVVLVILYKFLRSFY